jgi:hypothetical protein
VKREDGRPESIVCKLSSGCEAHDDDQGYPCGERICRCEVRVQLEYSDEEKVTVCVSARGHISNGLCIYKRAYQESEEGWMCSRSGIHDDLKTTTRCFV